MDIFHAVIYVIVLGLTDTILVSQGRRLSR